MDSIVICDHCKGKGVVDCSELVNYHRGEYDTWTEECWQCEGSGRKEETITTVHAPFKPTPPRAREGES